MALLSLQRVDGGFDLDDATLARLGIRSADVAAAAKGLPGEQSAALRVLRDGQAAWPGGGIDPSGADAYWCCCMHATQVLADVARWGVVLIDNKPTVTWMASGRWTFKLDGREVTVSACML